jgi:predicted nucleotidyltransferase
MISLRSSITRKTLNYFFLNPQNSFYPNELSRKLSLDKRNLVKKLNELESEGLLRSEKKGNLRLFKLNREYPFFKEIRNIVLKTTGLEENLRDILQQVPGIDRIYVFGSWAQGKMGSHSDIDLLVVGEHSIAEVQELLNAIQSRLNREINAVNMGKIDFEKRLKKGDPFLVNIMGKKHIEILR